MICVFLLGPTCSGKTKLSLEICKYLPLEIINFDSSIFYKYMNIGTGKPTKTMLVDIKHHLIDILDPSDKYSVWNFCIDALFIVFDCFSRSVIPLFVGGTMMYAWYFQNFFYFLNAFFMTNKFCLSKYVDLFLLYFNLKSVYKNFFNDSHLIKNFFSFDIINIFLLPLDKNIFYCKIKNRFFNMLEIGFLEEVLFLRSKNEISFHSNAMKAIGYKELWLYLDNKIDFSTVLNSILLSTFRLSDIQLKWLKKFNGISFYVENKDNKSLTNILKILGNYV